MREKYESLALVQLKELAKIRGIKGVSAMKKADVVEAMLAEDEKDKAREEASKPAEKEAGKPAEKPVEKAAEKSEPARTEAHRAEGGRAEGTRAETARAETARTETTRTEASRPAPAEGEQPARPVRVNEAYDSTQYPVELDSGIEAEGILEVMPDGYGFIRSDNYLPGSEDVYVAPSQIRRFGLKTGDILRGNKRIKTQQEKFSALLFVRTINGYTPEESAKRTAFEDMTPIFPDERIKLETPGCSVAMRVMDLISPVGKGQRGMIVSPPKAGKTTLLKEVAQSILRTNPHMHMLILLIDERPEEVTDIREAICGDNVEVIYSTFDELPEHHKRVAEMVVERAKRLVEHKKEVVILLDSITRLTRAYNLVVPPAEEPYPAVLTPPPCICPRDSSAPPATCGREAA